MVTQNKWISASSFTFIIQQRFENES